MIFHSYASSNSGKSPEEEPGDMTEEDEDDVSALLAEKSEKIVSALQSAREYILRNLREAEDFEAKFAELKRESLEAMASADQAIESAKKRLASPEPR